MLFVEKYAPKKMSQVYGNKDAATRVKQWGLQFTLGNPQKPLLLIGPSGCGKSSMGRAIAGELGWQLITVQPSDAEDSAKFDRQLSSALSGSSLFGDPPLVLIDDVQDWQGAGVRGAISKLAAALKTTNSPIVITARDAYDRAISPIKTSCEILQLKAINSSDVKAALERISSEEKLGASEDDIAKIASCAGGDLRAATNDLQAKNLSSVREHESKLLERVRSCFRAPNYSAAKKLGLGALMERDTLKLYVAENIHLELKDAGDLAQGLHYLSRADVFDGRIRRNQYWGYLRYSSDLLAYGVAASKRHAGPAFVPYMFPSYIQKLGASKSRRAMVKALSQKISIRTHTTTRTARQFVPLIQAQGALYAKTDSALASRIGAYYSFDEEELAYVLGISPDTLSKGDKKKKSTSE